MKKLFLSHSHNDHRLAEAISTLVSSCFPGHIEVVSSSASPSDGGIAMGSHWLEWVQQQVRESNSTAVLLTPDSVQKPWLMWEAGAVSGVALASEQEQPVIPIVFRISMDQVPGPLQSRQSALGEDREAMKRILETLREGLPVRNKDFEQLFQLLIPKYLEAIAAALAGTPPPLTESVIQDWMDRLDFIERTNRRSEIGQFHRAMVNVFAPGDNAFDTPLDVRLHRRLGDIYLFGKLPQQAAKQYELALRMYPRDTMLLHKLGLAEIESGNEQQSAVALERIVAIDPEAPRRSTEIAGLKGRLLYQKSKQSGSEAELMSARDAYADGLEHNPLSHYMADCVGQLSLLLCEKDRARDAFQKGLDSIQETGDQGYWAIATKASCHLGLGQSKAGLEALAMVSTLGAEPAARESIRRGLVRLHEGLGSEESELHSWLAALSQDSNT